MNRIVFSNDSVNALLTNSFISHYVVYMLINYLLLNGYNI